MITAPARAHRSAATATPTCQPGRVSRSSKTMIPSTTLTAGLDTDTAAIAGASWPVASDSCWIRNAMKPNPSSAHVRQSLAASPIPTWRSLMTGFENSADSPKNRPAQTPSTAARTVGVDCVRSHSSTSASIAQMARIAKRNLRPEALATPASGSPTSTNIAKPTTTTHAPSTCRRVMICAVIRYPSGSAHTIVVTSSGWTTTIFPRSRAAPCVQ
jgi:hypothetical protein